MRRRDRRGAAGGLDTRPARDDAPLHAALDDARMGRWEGVRDLLAATGADWDRRGFRLRVLARTAGNLRWADTWAAAEPGSAHALAALAQVRAARAVAAGPDEGYEPARAAWQTALDAADAWPADPTPFAVLLALTRVHFPDAGRLQEVWRELTVRDPYHREGHHEVIAYLRPSGPGGGGTSARMYNWVQEAVHALPYGSPLVVLRLAAHAELHRHRLAEAGLPPGLTMDHPWRDGQDAETVHEAWWQVRAAVPHADFHDDANFLAHALGHAGRDGAAAEVFAEIGPYASAVPWAYCGADPAAAFLATRSRAARTPEGRAAGLPELEHPNETLNR